MSIFPPKFLFIVLITSVWVNISEVFRFFIVVLPEMKQYLSLIPNVIPVNWIRFLIWGIWDTILTIVLVYIVWICSQYFGKTKRTIFVSSTICWITFFLLFWIALANMNLSKLSLLAYTLPLSWVEMVIGAWISTNLLKYYTQKL